jgi:hypothetical protein
LLDLVMLEGCVDGDTVDHQQRLAGPGLGDVQVDTVHRQDLLSPGDAHGGASFESAGEPNVPRMQTTNRPSGDTFGCAYQASP